MKMEVTFPDETTYALSLGRLRKALKPNICDLSMRRRSIGVLISGGPDKVVAAMLLLPEGYRITDVSDLPLQP